jgi:2-oxoglutarate dehydrogenase E2 component (dihydrolipoamide succinyltransferase)
MQVEIKVPVLPESVTEGTLGDWHKQVGDSVAVDENIVDLETDKVVLEIVAQKAGVIESIAFASGDTVKDGEVLGVINTEAAATGATDAAPADDSAAANRASPAVRKLLNENDLSGDEIQGTGKKGAILKKDVELYLQQPATPAKLEEPRAEAPPAATPAAAVPVAAAIPVAGRNDRRVPMSR